jgi:membrane protein YqaA with SNARE-associated domain
MEALAALFAASFVAATLFPLPSEAALIGYLRLYPDHAVLAVAVATLGNTAGGMTSYAIGRFLPDRKLHERAKGWVARYGAPITFFAWFPILGDALCVAAGWLRIHWASALAFMAAGRLARYVGIAFLAGAV